MSDAVSASSCECEEVVVCGQMCVGQNNRGNVETCLLIVSTQVSSGVRHSPSRKMAAKSEMAVTPSAEDFISSAALLSTLSVSRPPLLMNLEWEARARCVRAARTLPGDDCRDHWKPRPETSAQNSFILPPKAADTPRLQILTDRRRKRNRKAARRTSIADMPCARESPRQIHPAIPTVDL